MQTEMEWCTRNAFSVDASENIGRCVLHSTNLKCTQTANGYNANYHLDSNFHFDANISSLYLSSHFNHSLSVGRVQDIETMKKLEM